VRAPTGELCGTSSVNLAGDGRENIFSRPHLGCVFKVQCLELHVGKLGGDDGSDELAQWMKRMITMNDESYYDE
jgi:hypothetical protein